VHPGLHARLKRRVNFKQPGINEVSMPLHTDLVNERNRDFAPVGNYSLVSATRRSTPERAGEQKRWSMPVGWFLSQWIVRKSLLVFLHFRDKR
jgi:hypothetical protein